MTEEIGMTDQPSRSQLRRIAAQKGEVVPEFDQPVIRGETPGDRIIRLDAEVARLRQELADFEVKYAILGAEYERDVSHHEQRADKAEQELAVVTGMRDAFAKTIDLLTRENLTVTIPRAEAAESALTAERALRTRLVEAAEALRAAQRAYMTNRGNNELGQMVGVKASELDVVLAEARALEVFNTFAERST